MYWVPRHLLQEEMTWPFKNFINIYKFVLVYYVGSNDFSSGWIGLTGVQIDTTAVDYLLDTVACIDAGFFSFFPSYF